MQEYIALLGTVRKDKVTGFTGMVSSVAFDAYGCVQVILQPRQVTEDGEVQKGAWFDTNRLEDCNERVLDVPAFAAAPLDHKHGPADKPGMPRGQS